MKYMSDPVKSSEIEDVLSSIRRLVSEESRSGPEAEPKSQAVANDAATEAASDEETGQEALVLTPALRVHEGGREEASQVSHAQNDQRDEQPDESVDSDVVLDAVAETVLADAVEEPLSLDDDDFAVENEQHPVDAAQTDDLTEEIGQYVERSDVEPEGSVEPFEDEPSEQRAEPPETLEAKIAALETLIGKPDATWEPEEGDLRPDEHGTEQHTPDVLDWEDHQPAEDLEEVPHSDEESEASSTDTAEPIEAPVIEDAQEPTTDAGLLDDHDAHVIDEDMLRDMVCEIVRQELQGALGERITRNVRRLVRREIHRALASQELD